MPSLRTQTRSVSKERIPFSLRSRCGLLAALLLSCLPALADDQRQTTVGMPGRIDQIMLPGSQLEMKPLQDSRSPIVLRITGSFPHGSAFRYDLVFYGLEPGEFDLKDYLIRSDGSSTEDLPAIRVTVRPVLPPGQVEPNQLRTRPTPRLGGYRMIAAVRGASLVED